MVASACLPSAQKAAIEAFCGPKLYGGMPRAAPSWSSGDGSAAWIALFELSQGGV